MYLQKTWIYGNRIEVRKYHTVRYNVKGEIRKKRQKPTSEQKELANENASRNRLRRLMINNFGDGDIHLTLTYKRECRPTPEESKELIRKFFRKLRAYYRKHGQEFKWILVKEDGEKRIHHHMVMNDVEGLLGFLRKAWPYGGVHVVPLYENQDYGGLADYFVKETKESYKKHKENGEPYRVRYSCSRNLQQPIEKTEVVSASAWRKEVKVPPTLQREGYQLEKGSEYTGTDIYGFPFQTYTFIRYGDERERKKKQSIKASKREKKHGKGIK